MTLRAGHRKRSLIAVDGLNHGIHFAREWCDRRDVWCRDERDGEHQAARCSW